MDIEIVSKDYAREYRFNNCYKCPVFFNGKRWGCKGSGSEITLMCTWVGAKWPESK